MSDNTIEAYNQFEKWLKGQPYWLQDAVYCIYHGIKIDDEQISAYIDMCIAQSNKQIPQYRSLSHEDLHIQKPEDKMTVLKLFDIKGVNDLAQDASLEFNEKGITVIYGLNGAGKSGYMRIFKQLSNSPFEETIQPNVFKKNDTRSQSCKFVVSDGIEQREIGCDLSLKKKDNPLASCDVFDTRISNDYIAKTNNVSYQPFVFTVLTELTSIADKINKQIKSKLESIQDVSISIPKDYIDHNETIWLNDLQANSIFPTKYEAWTQEQQTELESIPKRLDNEIIKSNLQLFETQYNNIHPITTDLQMANNTIKSKEFEDKYDKYIDAQRKYLTAQKLFTETADALDTISVKIHDWKDMWKSAQQYFESFIGKDDGKRFGDDDSICPLCHQLVVGEVAKRIRSVNEYVNGKYSNEYSKGKDEIKLLISTCLSRSFTVEQIRGALSGIIEEEKLSIVESIYLYFQLHKDYTSLDEEYQNIRKLDIESTINTLLQKEKELEEKINSCRNALEDENRKALYTKLLDLNCLKWIYDNKANIKSAILSTKKRQELEKAKTLVTTNKITSESNYLAGVLITDAYIDRFDNIIKQLAPKIKVILKKAPSQKGSTPYKVTIDTDTGIKCRPEDILSEGEQRIVALAAFFADATGREALTPLIIDDPISSLDHVYERSATEKIVQLAKERQVIVFTHRISMLVEIDEVCEQYGIQLQKDFIRSTQQGKGMPERKDVYTGNVKSQLNALKDRLRDIKKKDPDSDEYNDSMGKAYQQFRICVERSVEEVLLHGMIKRFDRQIKTMGLVNKLSKIEESDCNIIDKMMTKYSFTEHSQPIDGPIIEYNVDDLENDINKYINWIEEYKRKTREI